MSRPSRMMAILKLRCPKCLRGTVFRGSMTMRDACSECGHSYEREPGYFLGAMYVSYFMSIPVLLLIAWLLHLFVFPNFALENVVLVALIPYLLFVPLVFRYSRVIWMHFDSPTE